MEKLVVIAGTNASGKSGLGIELAQHYGAEIVSADSRQVYKGLDLGSGKVTPEEMAGVPHHLIDVAAPNDFYSLLDFQQQAYAAIDGREFVLPDDVKKVAVPVLSHRIVSRSQNTIRLTQSNEAIMEAILESVPAPI